MVNVYTETKKYTIESAKEELEIDNIDFLNNQEVFEKDSGYIRSAVWMDMQRMLVRESNVLIENFVWCMHCKNMLPYCASTTTRLIDHIRKCKDRPHTDTDSVAKISFKMDELKPLRDAGARFVVMDFRPAAAIEGEGLLDYMFHAAQLGGKYPKMTKADLKNAIGTRNTCTSRVKELALNGKNLIARKIRHAIDVAGKFGVTADMWTEPHSSASMLGITVHFFTVEEAGIKLEAYTADLREIVAASVTGVVVKNAIYDVFGDLGFGQDEVREHMHLVTDRGSNMLLAAAEFDSDVCKIHLANNVMKHMFKDVPEAKDILTKSGNLVRYMKSSHAGAQMTSRLKSYPDTRFNWAHDMLVSIVENYDEVLEILSEKERATNKSLTEKITCLSVDELTPLIDFLDFFKHVTVALEGEKHVTLNRVWPFFRELRAVLQPKQTDTELIKKMKVIGREYIDKPENEQYFEPTLMHKLALFLHPQMSRLSFLNFRGRST